MEPSKEAIAVRLTRLNRLILGKVTGASNNFNKRAIDREALLDALTVLYDECNDDPVKKVDDLVKAFVDKYRSTVAELRRTRVCISDFKILQVIGRGHFGEVHLAREKETGDVYALKTIRKELVKRRGAACVEEEREILASGNGPWLPKLQYAFQDHNTLYLVVELCSGGDLAGLLERRNQPLSERDAAFYIAEVAHALRFLHDHGYVHRDVKPHNILLDRCGHIKLGDFGSSVRLSEGKSHIAVGTADYVAPELLAAAQCAERHASCMRSCRGASDSALTACDYWSLGVVAFELVTLRLPFSSSDDDSMAMILANIQRFEREGNPDPPFDPLPSGPSAVWRSLVAGLLRVQPSKRFHYLDTMQHSALKHLSPMTIRDQVPPWVPTIRGPEDASHFPPASRLTPPPSVAGFRERAPFAGQLPFIGYSYVAPDTHDESHISFSSSSSHDCTAIDMATFKSAEKLAVIRGREIANLQSKLANAEAEASAELERAVRNAQDEAERVRARLQADITALTLQNKRLERQVEIEKEERMALERNNQEVSSFKERNVSELRKVQSQAAELECERSILRQDIKRLESRVAELQAECDRAFAAADEASLQQKHYRESVAKERALRRQTVTDMSSESRETAARIASATANLANETRAKEQALAKLSNIEVTVVTLQRELDEARRDLARIKENSGEKNRHARASAEELKQVQLQLAQERVRSSTLLVQVQELQQSLKEADKRETELEEQTARTEARLQEKLEAAEKRAIEALKEDAKHREKVHNLEQLVRQLEREVNALESRNEPVVCKKDIISDTESMGESESATQAQITLLKEQLERAEKQLQARADEMASLKQEARTANLARWRKEREYSDLSTQAKTSEREIKRLEERITNANDARKNAEQKLSALQTEVADLKPKYEVASKELAELKQQWQKLFKAHEIMQAEVDRSRNDILKLKSELQYSEKRRIRAEQMEELASTERAQLRDETHELRAGMQSLEQNNKALQEACSLLEDQLTDLEKLADVHEVKNKDLETECTRMRTELSSLRNQLSESERRAADSAAAAAAAERTHHEARDHAERADTQIARLTERLEHRTRQVQDLEARLAAAENACGGAQTALSSAVRRVRELQEECAAERTRAREHRTEAAQAQAQLAQAQEELSAAREAAAAAAAWWRTREMKADATLKQQAKLIDFLQAKVEEAKRKKGSLSNKLFGRSGRRPSNASPPLRRANKELREEVERLRTKLASRNSTDGDYSVQSTPMKEKPKQVNGTVLSIDTPDCSEKKEEFPVQVVWSEGKRDSVKAICKEGVLVFPREGCLVRAALSQRAPNKLAAKEADKSFSVTIEDPSSESQSVNVVCADADSRNELVSRLRTVRFGPRELRTIHSQPSTALLAAPDSYAIGCPDGLHSLRGPIRLEWDSNSSELTPAPVTQLANCGNRILFIYQDVVVHASALSLGSILKRVSTLRPSVTVTKLRLPDTSAPHLIQSIKGTSIEGGPCVTIACGRRVFVLKCDASISDFKVARSVTIDRSASALLLTAKCLYIAGEKLLRLNLPASALETFAKDEPTVAAAAKKRSPPIAILLIKENPLEILVCYAECGVFLDENGRRTRSDDPKWTKTMEEFVFVSPFLYATGEGSVTMIHINDDSFKSPPCTCDNHSVASTPSECYTPATFTTKLSEPSLIGTVDNGVIIRTKCGDEFSVSILEGMAAFGGVGASVESLDTISQKSSSTDFGQSLTDLSPQEDPRDTSQESIEPNTGFLADIRKRAQQLRNKNKHQPPSDDVIKEILTTEVGMKRRSNGRRSPPSTTEFSSDSESENVEPNQKTPADICAEMFSRQVRFQ